jgi:hypothetical protein
LDFAWLSTCGIPRPFGPGFWFLVSLSLGHQYTAWPEIKKEKKSARQIICLWRKFAGSAGLLPIGNPRNHAIRRISNLSLWQKKAGRVGTPV